MAIALSIVIGLVFLFWQTRMFLQARSSVSERGQRWQREVRSGARSVQTREAALADLERSVATCPSSAHLRRLGVVAPLLGVTLTALSFMYNSESVASLISIDPPVVEAGLGLPVEITARDARSQLVQAGVVPLFWGVMVGAMLAIMNQFLQTRLSHREDEVLTACAHPSLAPQFKEPDSAFTRFGAGIQESTQMLASAATQLDAMMRSGSTTMKQLAAGAKSVSSELQSSGAALRSSVEVPAAEFAAAAVTMKTSAQTVANQMETGFGFLGGKAVQLQAALDSVHAAQAAAAERQNANAASMQKAVENFKDMADQVRSALTLVSGSVERLEGKTANEIREQLAALSDSTQRYSESVERSAAASGRQNTAISEVVEAFRTAAADVREASASTRQMESKTASDLREQLKLLTDSTKRYCDSVERSATASGLQTSAIAEVVEELRGAAVNLRQALQGVKESKGSWWWNKNSEQA